MRLCLGLILTTWVALMSAASLSDICTPDYLLSALPEDGVLPGVAIDLSSIQTQLVYNEYVSSEWYPSATISYCNATFAYSHAGLSGDVVHVSYWLPAPSQFSNRYLSTGGSGFAINSGALFSPSGIIVGAVSGITDGGFGSFDVQFDAAFLLANGTINWPATYMFGYQAHHELAILGKHLSRNLYNVSDEAKIYSYYQGCSEGGREGWSQLQRFADQFDGAAIGAPALRYGQQQVNHLFPNVVMQTMGYYPPSCELSKIVNLTIAACDLLDGRADGVVSRSDLCRAHFNLDSIIGTPYSCTANRGTPAQNGTVTAEGVTVARTLFNGLHDTKGQRAYIWFQPGADFADVTEGYNNVTGSWDQEISGFGGEWVAKFLELQDVENLNSLVNVTYDVVRDWMSLGMNRYYDSLQTTYPDLSAFRAAGGKVLHVHGEQDDSIPTGSSVYYYDSVRKVMYPNLGYNESVAELDEFYRLFLVPGSAHCLSNELQPNSSWPPTTLQTVIDWVEDHTPPAMLNGTGEIDTICKWPLRPLWSGNGTVFECVYSQESIDSFTYVFDAYQVPIF